MTSRAHNTDVNAERLLIGRFLVEPPAILTTADIISADDFTDPFHRACFEACWRLVNRHQTPNTTLLDSELGHPRPPGDIDGLVIGTPGEKTEDLAVTVHRLSVKRKVYAAALEIQELCLAAETDDALDQAQNKILELGATLRRGSDIGLRNGPELARAFKQNRDRIIEMRADSSLSSREKMLKQGCTTGIREVDEMTGMLTPGSLTVLAALTSCGKSAYAVNTVALENAKAGKTVLYFSCEDTEIIFANRLVANLGNVGQSYVRDHSEAEQDKRLIAEGLEKLSQFTNFFYDDSAGLCIEDIENRAMSLRVTRDIDLVVVDYVQLLGIRYFKHPDPNERIKHVMGRLKELARRMKCAVIVLAQLNKEGEARASKIPEPNDIEGSGAIKQYADNIIMLFSPWKFFEKMGNHHVTGQYVNLFDDWTMLCLKKAKQGITGSTPLGWRGPFVTFTDMRERDPEHYELCKTWFNEHYAFYRRGGKPAA